MSVYRATLASRGRVLVPRVTRRLPLGLWLHGSCRLLPRLANDVSGRLAQVATSLVPGRAASWSPPFPPHDWSSWLAASAEILGTSPATWIVQLPADRRRKRFNLLLLSERFLPVAFAKFTANPVRPAALRAQMVLTENPPKSFWCPRLLHHGHLAGWSFAVISPMPQCPHAPARLSAEQRRVVLGEMQSRLLSDMDLANGEVPIHGDFGPWNVRRMAIGQLAVIDWEEVAVGPAAADEVWHCVTSGLVRGWSPSRVVQYTRRQLGHHSRLEWTSAARFWLGRLAEPEPEEVATELARSHRASSFLSGQLEVLKRLGSAR